MIYDAIVLCGVEIRTSSADQISSEVIAWRKATVVDADELELALAGANTLTLPWTTDARLRRQWLADTAGAETA